MTLGKFVEILKEVNDNEEARKIVEKAKSIKEIIVFLKLDCTEKELREIVEKYKEIKNKELDDGQLDKIAGGINWMNMDKLKKGEIDWIDMDEIEKKCLESTKKYGGEAVMICNKRISI